MVYTRPAHGDPFADSSATDATVIIDALADGLEAVETSNALKLASATAASTYAPIASPTFTGTAAAPTPAVATDSTTLATTAFVGLRVLVTHPNTTDVLVRAWDVASARWQTVHYDSGWRDVSADLANSCTGTLYIRRTNYQVQLALEGVQHASGANKTFYVAPSAFAPSATITQRFLAYALTGPAVIRGDAPPSWNINLVSMSAATGYYGVWNYATDAAIPATLPGSAMVSAPNA